MTAPDRDPDRKSADAFWEASELAARGYDVTAEALARAAGEANPPELDAALEALATIREALPTDVPDALAAGTRLGPYETRGLIGRGGMGSVYDATHQEDGAPVALKVLRPQLADDPTAAVRFQREAEIASRLSHPHLVRVLDAGVEQGLHYYAMERVVGETLGAHVRARSPALPDRAAVRGWATRFAALARALAYAHDVGIVHRDVKPNNILIDEEGALRLTDFGIARPEHLVTLTGSSAILGTPVYMAPEQARAKPAEIGPATDLYGLGASLYEAVTGTPPVDASGGYAATLNSVMNVIPPTARGRNTAVPRDLDRLLRVLLAKDPAQRPASAAAVAQTLETIASGRDAPILRVMRRRQRALAAIVVVLGALVVGVAWWLRVARDEADTARRAGAAALREAEHAARLARAQERIRAADGPGADRELTATPNELRGWAWRWLARRADTSDRILEFPDPPQDVALSPDRRRLAVLEASGRLTVWDTTSWRRIREFRAHQGSAMAVAWSPDGELVATASKTGEGIRVFAAGSGALVRTFQGPVGGWYDALDFSPDSALLGCHGFDGHVRIWRVESGALVTDVAPRKIGWGLFFRFLPNGERVIASSCDARVLRVIDGAVVSSLSSPRWEFISVAARHPSRPVAFAFTGRDNTEMFVWNYESGRILARRSIDGLRGAVYAPSGERLFAGFRGRIEVLEPTTLRTIDVLLGERAPPVGERRGSNQPVAWLADGRLVSIGRNDRTLRVWPREPPDTRDLDHPGIHDLFFTREGKPVTLGSGELKVWTAAGHPERAFDVAVPGAVVGRLSPDGGRLYAGGLESGVVGVQDLDTGTFTPFGHHGDHGERRSVISLTVTTDGRFIATGGGDDDRTARIWDTANGHLVHTLRGHAGRIITVAFSPDGRRLVTGSARGRARVWDVRTGALVRELSRRAVSPAYSPDGRWIAAGRPDGLALFDAKSGDLLADLTDVTATETAWTAGGRRLLAGTDEIHVFAVPSMRRLLTIDDPAVRAWRLDASPTGDAVLVPARDVRRFPRLLSTGRPAITSGK